MRLILVTIKFYVLKINLMLQRLYFCEILEYSFKTNKLRIFFDDFSFILVIFLFLYLASFVWICCGLFLNVRAKFLFALINLLIYLIYC